MNSSERDGFVVAGLDAPIDVSPLVLVEVPPTLRVPIGPQAWPGLVVAARVAQGDATGAVATWICAEPRDVDEAGRGNIGPAMAMNAAARRISDLAAEAVEGSPMWSAMQGVIGAGLVEEAVSSCLPAS